MTFFDQYDNGRVELHRNILEMIAENGEIDLLVVASSIVRMIKQSPVPTEEEEQAGITGRRVFVLAPSYNQSRAERVLDGLSAQGTLAWCQYCFFSAAQAKRYWPNTKERQCKMRQLLAILFSSDCFQTIRPLALLHRSGRSTMSDWSDEVRQIYALTTDKPSQQFMATREERSAIKRAQLATSDNE